MRLKLLFLSTALLLSACNKKQEIPLDAVVELHMTQTIKAGPVTIVNKALSSGFFIDSDGSVMTARHCVKGFTEIEVVTSDHKSYNARVVKVSETDDIAIIRIARKNKSYLKIAREDVKIGDMVTALGSPLGLTGTFVKGYVSNLGGSEVLLDITLLPGYSGCPLLNDKNEVVGIGSKIVLFRNTASHLSIMVGLEIIRDFLDESPFKDPIPYPEELGKY